MEVRQPRYEKLTLCISRTTKGEAESPTKRLQDTSRVEGQPMP